MVSHPETGSDSPIGSDRELGRDTSRPKLRRVQRNTQALGSSRKRRPNPFVPKADHL